MHNRVAGELPLPRRLAAGEKLDVRPCAAGTAGLARWLAITVGPARAGRAASGSSSARWLDVDVAAAPTASLEPVRSALLKAHGPWRGRGRG